MRIPARCVDDHLVWSNDGPTWAVWRVAKPVSYPHLSRARKISFIDKVKRALTAMPGESMILSVCQLADPADAVDRMLDGVDLDANPAWRDEAEWTYEVLSQGSNAFDRYFFVAVALPEEGRRKLTSSVAASSSWLTSLAGVRPAPPTSAERDRLGRVADRIEHGLRSSLAELGVRPATAAEIRWIHLRAPYRGVHEPEFPTGNRREGSMRGFEHLVDAVYHEGGVKADENRRNRRYVRVETEMGVSYQTFLMVAETPREWDFPDGAGEWFAVADSAPYPVDWCARITAVPNDVAQRKSRRQARELTSQVDEYDGEPSGAPGALFDAMEAVEDQRSELSASRTVPELETSIIFSIASNDLLDLEDQADSLRAMFHAWEYSLPRPIGHQMQLMRAMLPGAATPVAAKDYKQHLMPLGLASSAPFAHSSVGEKRGLFFGFLADAGLEVNDDGQVVGGRPVFTDPSHGPRNKKDNKSGCIFGVGGLGGGKSYQAKRLIGSVLATGGQAVTLDRTVKGEYVRASKAWAGRKQIVKVEEGSEFCIDPFLVFAARRDQIRYATGFLIGLTGVGPTDDEGALLTAAVRAVAERPQPRMRDVIDELRTTFKRDPHADRLARKIENFADNALAQLVFGDGEGLRLDADCVVFWTPNMPLPTARELDEAHLWKKLSAEKLVGQGVLYLVAAIMREIVFSDSNRFAVANFDEVWWLDTPAGIELLTELIRDSRKDCGAVWIWSQHPNDLRAELLSLIPIRLVFRQGASAAAEAVALVREADSHWVEAVQSFVSGEVLMSDVDGRAGHVRCILAPPHQDAVFHTTPGDGGTNETVAA